MTLCESPKVNESAIEIDLHHPVTQVFVSQVIEMSLACAGICPSIGTTVFYENELMTSR